MIELEKKQVEIEVAKKFTSQVLKLDCGEHVPIKELYSVYLQWIKKNEILDSSGKKVLVKILRETLPDARIVNQTGYIVKNFNYTSYGLELLQEIKAEENINV